MSEGPGEPGIPAQRVDDQPRTAERRSVPRVIAVVSDGSALRDDPPIEDRDSAPDALALLLEDDAAGLHARSGRPVWAATLPARDTEDLVALLRGLPADTGAIFLTHTDPVRARAAQRAVCAAGGPPVVTDADTTMVSLAAALLTTLARVGREPAASEVVIAGAAVLPELCPLLIACGVGDISSWNSSDARSYPLHHLTRHATAVIDLLGATTAAAGPAGGDRGSGVISGDDPRFRLLPAPGLLAALARCPDAPLDLDVLRGCALALAAATPPGELVPDLDDPHLAEAVAAALGPALTQRPPSSAHRPPYPMS